MQSSLSWPRATTNFKFQQKTDPVSSCMQRYQFLISYPKAANSSSFPLRLRSQFQSLELLNNKGKESARTSKRFQLQCGISSDSSGASDGSRKSFSEWIEWVGEVSSAGFPVWVSLGCLCGLVYPSSFSWVTPRWSIFGLTLAMLGIGMTLTLDDLRGALAMPKELISCFVLQYTVMPLSGYLVSKLLDLPSHYAAGLILVGCCPGGTASNIVTYIARGNVALSVMMTTASTLSAVILTPFLTDKLAGQYVAVDAAAIVMSTLQVVLLPVLGGAFINQYFHGLVKFVSPLMTTIAVGTVAILCGNAIAQSAAIIVSGLQVVLSYFFFRACGLFVGDVFPWFLGSIHQIVSEIIVSGLQVVVACFLLHGSGFYFGYILSRFLRLDVASSRTISIEVGMQNSVLAIILASQHFQNPLTAVPGAVSIATHCIFGGILAGIWRGSVPKQKQE